jgi:hypothetical protein
MKPKLKTSIRQVADTATYPIATHINNDGKKFQLRVVLDIVPTQAPDAEHESSDLSVVESELGLTSLAPAPRPLPPKTVIFKKINKFDLIEKLLALDVIEEFYALISSLPIAERLKWDAAQNISEDYPFLVENKQQILTSLNLTEEQFSDIFK